MIVCFEILLALLAGAFARMDEFGQELPAALLVCTHTTETRAEIGAQGGA